MVVVRKWMSEKVNCFVLDYSCEYNVFKFIYFGCVIGIIVVEFEVLVKSFDINGIVEGEVDIRVWKGYIG